MAGSPLGLTRLKNFKFPNRNVLLRILLTRMEKIRVSQLKDLKFTNFPAFPDSPDNDLPSLELAIHLLSFDLCRRSYIGKLLEHPWSLVKVDSTASDVRKHYARPKF